MKLKNIYNMEVIKRTIIMWVLFQILLWLVFGISFLLHKDAWTNVIEVIPNTAAVGGWWTTLLFIIFNNLIICLLIIIGNIFVRFNVVTPGILVLIVQAITIGWLAGSNGFEVPFASVMAANIGYLRIGLWETTTYILVCAVTLPKSLYIANTFPATKWDCVRKLSDVKLDRKEIVILVIGGCSLIAAAIIETIRLFGQ